jgi:hypothetical protein
MNCNKNQRFCYYGRNLGVKILFLFGVFLLIFGLSSVSAAQCELSYVHDSDVNICESHCRNAGFDGFDYIGDDAFILEGSCKSYLEGTGASECPDYFYSHVCDMPQDKECGCYDWPSETLVFPYDADSNERACGDGIGINQEIWSDFGIEEACVRPSDVTSLRYFVADGTNFNFLPPESLVWSGNVDVDKKDAFIERFAGNLCYKSMEKGEKKPIDSYCEEMIDFCDSQCEGVEEGDPSYWNCQYQCDPYSIEGCYEQVFYLRDTGVLMTNGECKSNPEMIIYRLGWEKESHPYFLDEDVEPLWTDIPKEEYLGYRCKSDLTGGHEGFLQRDSKGNFVCNDCTEEPTSSSYFSNPISCTVPYKGICAYERIGDIDFSKEKHFGDKYYRPESERRVTCIPKDSENNVVPC